MFGLIANVQYYIHHKDICKAVFEWKKHSMNNGKASGVSGILFEASTHTLSSPVYVHYETASVSACRREQRRWYWSPASTSTPRPLWAMCFSISLKSLSFNITTNTHCHETPFFFHPITVLSVARCPGTTQLYFCIIFKINYSETSNAFPVMVPPQFSCFCLSLFLSPSLFFCVCLYTGDWGRGSGPYMQK